MYFDHTHLLTPSSVDDLIAIIKSAHENHRKVKVLGAGHSRSAIAHSSDVYVSLCNYTGDLWDYSVLCIAIYSVTEVLPVLICNYNYILYNNEF